MGAVGRRGGSARIEKSCCRFSCNQALVFKSQVSTSGGGYKYQRCSRRLSQADGTQGVPSSPSHVEATGRAAGSDLLDLRVAAGRAGNALLDRNLPVPVPPLLTAERVLLILQSGTYTDQEQRHHRIAVLHESKLPNLNILMASDLPLSSREMLCS